MDEIAYRKLVWTDIDRFIELRKLQLQEEGAVPVFDISQPLLEYYQKHYNDGTFVSWLAIKNNEIIGTSGMSFIEKPPYYSNLSGKIGILSSMYTLNIYRRMGIGKKLLELVVNETKEYGCGAVHITASDVGVLLYQNFGFKKNSKFLYYNLY